MTGTSTYDFDLHGIVGIRLLDATPEDLAKVGRQLGPLRRELDREPDISIRFVDETSAGRLTYVGLGDTAFDANAFFALRGAGGVRGKALLPLDRIGRHPVIVCERWLPAVQRVAVRPSRRLKTFDRLKPRDPPPACSTPPGPS